MGGGLEFDITHGAVAALWNSPTVGNVGWYPVLQVADVRPATARLQRHPLSLSDGVYSLPAMLARYQSHLVTDGALRRGSMIRILHFTICRNIIFIQLEILQTECALIGNLKPYEQMRKSGGFTTRSTRYALRPDYEPCFGGLPIQQSCMVSATEKSANGLSYHGPRGASNPAGATPSSLAQSAEPAVWKTVGQFKAEKLGYSYKPDFITVKATISSANNEDLCWVACPLVANGKRCNVKATGNRDGVWHRKGCGHGFGYCDYGHSVCIQIQDHTGTAFVAAYEEAAKEIFGFTAKDLYSMKYEKDYARLDDIILSVVGKQYVFQLKVEGKPFCDRWLVGCMVVKAEEVNPSAESHRLLGAIDVVLPEGVGSSCLEFGNSMPTCYSGLSDSKACSTVRSSISSHAIRAAHARWLGSADGSAAKPTPSLSASGVQGCGNRGTQTCPSYTGGQRPSAPDGFVGGLYGSGGFMGRFPGPLPVEIDTDARCKHSTQTYTQGGERRVSWGTLIP